MKQPGTTAGSLGLNSVLFDGSLPVTPSLLTGFPQPIRKGSRAPHRQSGGTSFPQTLGEKKEAGVGGGGSGCLMIGYVIAAYIG